MNEHERLRIEICGSAQRALEGQTPAALRAYSFSLDEIARRIYVRAHFAKQPSDGDLEDISVVETEIDADFLDHFEAEADFEVVPAGLALAPLADGFAYLREGEPGILCGQVSGSYESPTAPSATPERS